ncbi:MAG: hypothetical protein JWP81_292 [Ferruginibacter sp.]|nr:hypothetical protein [Ferruginibacter sp.]
MKKIVVLLVICLGASQLFSQTLFTYGTNAVSRDEFLRAYNKNKTPVENKEKSLREYLELYYRFKLKVKAARELKLDTLPQQVFDLQNFRSQVAEGYMNDQQGVNKLVNEALQRSQKDIHLQHFYISLPSAMSAADTLKAYTAMSELAGKLKEGTTDYAAITSEISRKYMEVKGQDMGYITALSVPYEIENIVYNLRPGGISRLYRTKSALHLFKNLEERKSAGKWKIAQVLLSVPPGAADMELKAIQSKADSIYALLVAGADFSSMAKRFSEDKLTYTNGGELPEFGTGKYELPFESKVFELKKDGEISKPIFTGYGYHIVKRLHQQEIPADNSDELFMATLKQQVLQDERINTVKANFIKTVKVKTGFKRNPAVSESVLYRYADSVAATKQVGIYPINNKTIFSFAKSKVKGSDWLNFIRDYKLNPDTYKGESNEALLEKYIGTATLDYYRMHLDEFDQEFKYQLEEFKEGNMLFEIMERNVWGKAANDSIGLQKYYNAHKATYNWAASADILLFECSDLNAAEAAITALRSGKNRFQVMEESGGKVQSDSGRYELSQLQLPAGMIVEEGSITKPSLNSGDKTTSFIKVLRMFPANQQRSYEEAKGLLINDYQGYLEEAWLQELKKKSPLNVNTPVFEAMLK